MCGHLDFDNQRDCTNEGKYMCRCCGVAVCEDHLEKRCPYGGELFEELEPLD